MKQKILFIVVLFAALATPLLPPPARAAVDLSFSFFHDSLAPYGDWIEVGDYGLCWRPNGVDEDWSPYTDGYWAYTDAGWTWVSYEDWGGITYHYGRWVRVLGEGWCWVPDYEWGPAWVSWRSGGDHVGWAPLPPEAHWREDVGFSVWVDNSYDIGPDQYSFCHTRDFGSPFLRPVCLPRERNVTIIQNTVNITNITFNRHNRCIFNGGPNFVNINKVCSRPVPALKLVRNHDVPPNFGGAHRRPGLRHSQEGNQLAVFAPRITRPGKGDAVKVRPARVVSADRINRGWARVSDPAQKQQLRQKLQQETKGLTPETAPARPVKPEDVAVVPTKADPNGPSPVAITKTRRRDSLPNEIAGAGVSPQPGVVNPPNGQPDKQRPDPVTTTTPGKKDRSIAGAGEAGPKTPEVLPQPGTPLPLERKPRIATEGPEAERPGKVGKDRKDRPAVVVHPRKNAEQPPARKGANGDAPSLRPFNDDGSDNVDRAAQGKGERSARDQAVALPKPVQPDANTHAAEKELRREQREQQQAAQQQRESAERAAELRHQQKQQANAFRQQEENANRAAEVRRAQQQQAEASRRQQENAGAGEARRQQRGEAEQRASEVQRQQQRQQHVQQQQQQQLQQQRAAAAPHQQQQAIQAQRAMQQQREAAMQRQYQQAQRPAIQQPQRQAEVHRQVQQPPRPQAPPPQSSGGNEGNGKKHKGNSEETTQPQRRGRF